MNPRRTLRLRQEGCVCFAVFPAPGARRVCCIGQLWLQQCSVTNKFHISVACSNHMYVPCSWGWISVNLGCVGLGRTGFRCT